MEIKDIARLSPDAQRQILDKLTRQKSQSNNRKYHNRKTVVNGIAFDSKREAERYLELLAMEQSGKIRRLRLQPEFTLIEAYKDAYSGEPVKAERYKADFSYQERDTTEEDRARFYGEEREIWLDIVEDVKGQKTQIYINKRKQVYEKFGIRIRET